MKLDKQAARKCSYCGKEENFPIDTKSELRPYGKGGSLICIGCVKSDKSVEEIAKDNFLKRLDKSSSKTGASLLSPEGPIPYLNKRGKDA